MDTWTEKLKDNPVEWLLKSNPWTKYKTCTDLLGLKEYESETIEAKTELVNDKKGCSPLQLMLYLDRKSTAIS